MANSNDTISERPENQGDLYILNPNHPAVSNRDNLLDEIFLNISKTQSLICLMSEQLNGIEPRQNTAIDTLRMAHDHLERICQVANKIAFLKLTTLREFSPESKPELVLTNEGWMAI